MIAATLLLLAHAGAASKLRVGESLAAPVPSSLDVLAALHRERVVASQRDVLDACVTLQLPLADMPHAAPVRLTRGWPL